MITSASKITLATVKGPWVGYNALISPKPLACDLIQAGNQNFKDGLFDKAGEAYRKGLIFDSKNVIGMFNLAVVRYLKEDLVDAEKWFREASKPVLPLKAAKESELAAPLLWRAKILKEAGKSKEALSLINSITGVERSRYLSPEETSAFLALLKQERPEDFGAMKTVLDERQAQERKFSHLYGSARFGEKKLIPLISEPVLLDETPQPLVNFLNAIVNADLQQGFKPLFLANQYFERGNLLLAEQALFKTNAKDPNIHSFLGNMYDWQGRIEESLIEYERAYSLHEKLSYACKIASQLGRLKRLPEMVVWCRKILEQDPGDKEILYALGFCCELLLDDKYHEHPLTQTEFVSYVISARKCLEEALRLDPDKNSPFAKTAREKLDKMRNYPGFNYS